MKKVVYTVITNRYDTLKEPLHQNPEWDFICFTDDETLTSDRWHIKLLIDEAGLTPHLLSRKPKILPHVYLPDYGFTLYMDAAYKITGDLNDLVDFNSDLSLVIRDLNRSVGDELADLVKYKTINELDAQRISDFLRADEYDTPRGTYYMGGLIGRKRSTKIDSFMEEWWYLVKNVQQRDQPWLQYLLWKHQIVPGEYSTRWVRNYLSYHFHDPKSLFSSTETDPDVYYFTPGDPKKKIGKTYNAHCESVPNNEDWICVRDGDTAFLTPNWSEIITETIKRYPDTALFGCYTNRIGLEYQLTEHGFSENLDMKHHAQIARDRWQKYGTECVEIDKPVAGMFMVFRRSVWTRVPFKDELVINNKFFDWDFGERILKLGGKVRLMKGLYLMHYYRADKGRLDKSHLL